MSTLRYASQRDWTSRDTDEHIGLGCQQRIAEATERMAAASEKMVANHDKMKRDLDWYAEQYRIHRVTIQALNRSNRSLKGHVTKLRRKVAALQEQP